MAGIAATVGSARVSLNRVTQTPSQSRCIRYMPYDSLDMSVIHLGASFCPMHVNMRKAPAVRTTQLIVQNAQPSSMTGVECRTPGTAWM